MKTLAALTLSVALLTGCQTPPSGVNVARIASIANTAAYMGSALWLVDHPSDRPTFLLVKATLDGLIQDGQYDPLLFRDALAKLPVKELKGEKGAILIDASVLIFDLAFQEYATTDQATWLKPIMVAVRDGLQRGLDRVPPVLPETKRKK